MENIIEKAAKLIKEGEIVAFPTETVYGLGADALNPSAVSKIFEAKGRPSDNPLIVHIAELEDLEKLAKDIPKEAYILAKKFWPGPLTIILPRQNCVPDITTAGLNTVAIRMPAHPIAIDLIKASGKFLAAPSANKSGRPSPTDAETVKEDFGKELPLIIDGGPCEHGLESTVIDLSEKPFAILRTGAVTAEEIEKILICHSDSHFCHSGPDPESQSIQKEILKQVQNDNKKSDQSNNSPKSPGMKYTHYAPKAKLILCQSTKSFCHSDPPFCHPELVSGSQVKKINSLIRELKTQNLKFKISKIGILCCNENQTQYKDADLVMPVGSIENLAEIASNLFRTLREFDRQGMDIIISESFPEEGMGKAIMERLTKAANEVY